MIKRRLAKPGGVKGLEIKKSDPNKFPHAGKKGKNWPARPKETGRGQILGDETKKLRMTRAAKTRDEEKRRSKKRKNTGWL